MNYFYDWLSESDNFIWYLNAFCFFFSVGVKTLTAIQDFVVHVVYVIRDKEVKQIWSSVEPESFFLEFSTCSIKNDDPQLRHLKKQI